MRTSVCSNYTPGKMNNAGGSCDKGKLCRTYQTGTHKHKEGLLVWYAYNFGWQTGMKNEQAISLIHIEATDKVFMKHMVSNEKIWMPADDVCYKMTDTPEYFQFNKKKCEKQKGFCFQTSKKVALNVDGSCQCMNSNMLLRCKQRVISYEEVDQRSP